MSGLWRLGPDQSQRGLREDFTEDVFFRGIECGAFEKLPEVFEIRILRRRADSIEESEDWVF
jgi:hypothetical protein